MGSFCTAKLFVSSQLDILLYNVGAGYDDITVITMYYDIIRIYFVPQYN